MPDLFASESIAALEREVAILTARHTAIFSAWSAGVFTYGMDKFTAEIQMAEIGLMIKKKLAELYRMTGDEIYNMP
jgi:hypothetical protein